MARSKNAQLAVDMYEQLLDKYGWSKTTAWHGIAILLLSCEVFEKGWEPFYDVVVYQERDTFKNGQRGPSRVLQRAGNLTNFLAAELGVSRSELCSYIGRYWHHPDVQNLQPNNLLGHAYRSLVVTVLEKFDDPGITYEEEVDPHVEFPGQQFPTRSKKPSLDIVARHGNNTVALISSRWRFRHDRVEVVEEALAYGTAARRPYPDCRLYASIAEFSPNRLEKILSNCAPAHPNPPLTAAIHLCPDLILKGLGENGRLTYLKGLDWLIDQTSSW